MYHLDNYERSLASLEQNDFNEALARQVVATGVIGQFSQTFELAWKTLQEALREDGVGDFVMGSPREIFSRAFSCGWLEDEQIWLEMLKKRNTLTHVYDADMAHEVLSDIFDRFIPALRVLATFLRQKGNETDDQYQKHPGPAGSAGVSS